MNMSKQKNINSNPKSINQYRVMNDKGGLKDKDFKRAMKI